MANLDEIKGKIKQASGDLTDDQKLKLEGHLQEALGKAKENSEDTLNDVSRKINEKIDEFKRENKNN